MPSKSKAKTLKYRELTHKELDFQVDFKPKGVKTSDNMSPARGVIGQKRAIDALRTGLKVPSTGYNIFVSGNAGTGRVAAVTALLEAHSKEQPHLSDVCYVNNFQNEDCPRVLTFKAGDGLRFKKDMTYLVSSLRKVVPKIFMSEDYKDRNSRIVREFENRQKALIHGFEERLNSAGFVMVQIQTGVGVRNEIQPLVEQEPVPIEQLERLARDGNFSLSKLDELRRAWDSLRREFDATTVESKKLSNKMEDALDKLNYSMVAPLVTDKVTLLMKRFGDQGRIFLQWVCIM